MTKFDLPKGLGALIRVPATVAEIRRWRRAAVKSLPKDEWELRNYVISIAACLEDAHASGEAYLHVL
jgi:hypothetical protein